MASKAKKVSDTGQDQKVSSHCNLPQVPEHQLAPAIDPHRAFLIRISEKKWVNGTVLHYAFLDTPAEWRGGEDQKQAVRDAFATWKELGIGLDFHEVSTPADAEIRIGFHRGDGSWSYVGRDSIDLVSDPTRRTMNFGWDVTTPYGRDTALHEIGHALGFPHEHQNPNAGIVWDEAAVIDTFSGPPNNWPESTIRFNILRKLDPAKVAGSEWDKDSIMHYGFPAGLIVKPERYKTQALRPDAGLSQTDIDRVRQFYPGISETPLPRLLPWESQRVDLGPGEQLDFLIEPAVSRDYTIQTLGKMDTVVVLFEAGEGEPRYLDGDDDSGWDRNARLVVRLMKGRRYLLRVRLYYAEAKGEGAVILY